MANDQRCAGCGAHLEPAFRFCAQCGRPVAGAPVAPPAPARRDTSPRSLPGQAPAAPAAPAAPQARPAGIPSLKLVPVRHDGRAGPAQPLQGAGVICGRAEGQLLFPDDTTVSPRHARFTPRGDGALLEDLGSLNGTFLRLRGPRPLALGDEVRLGRQLLRLEAIARPAAAGTRPWGSPDPGYRARLVQLLDGSGTGEAFPLKAGENLLGREVGDVTFPQDRYVSARHARLDVLASAVVLVDLGSSNGTFLRVAGPVPVTAGDQVLVGMQLVRLE
ncbi:FHA domain-containing protein [Anaeromyxobacter diazotrophicus]|uniref:FHA domain-containing protein n=1 Tax=Anaeromyxobacter diazotrophicus TaxID=2590199 RepID=A0A7I9VP74_9BACT|nr:FHA domain-containing protein [Anaeromyxobacter diazotrophicus]GEJ57910.1 hypothetical protein AMYX_26510 [Anaeromyxobacter diazotrophicus]